VGILLTFAISRMQVRLGARVLVLFTCDNTTGKRQTWNGLLDYTAKALLHSVQANSILVGVFYTKSVYVIIGSMTQENATHIYRLDRKPQLIAAEYHFNICRFFIL
jgi:hypothetical protein